MLGAVDLDQLADALAPITRLVNPAAALHAIRPETGVEHPQPQRLAPDGDAVDLAQLLGGQRRPEIRVARLDQLQGLGLDVGRHLPIAGSAALLGNEGGGAVLLIGLRQSEHLTALQAHQLAGRRDRQPTGRQIAQDLDSAKLLVAHEVQRHFGGPPTQNEGGCHL